MMRATARRSSWARQPCCRVDKHPRPLSQAAVNAPPERSSVEAYSGQYERPVERFVTQEDVDLALQRGAKQSEAWHRVTAAERIRILEDMRSRMIKCSLQMGRRGAKCATTQMAKNIYQSGNALSCRSTAVLKITQVTGYGDPDNSDAVPTGQAHLLAFVYASVICKRLTYEIELLEGLQRGAEDAGASGAAPAAAPAGGLAGLEPVPVVRQTADGREVVLVQRENPKAVEEVAGCRGEIYLQPGYEVSQGSEYARMHAQPADGVCCVLGGGNQPSIAILDVVHVMFRDNTAVCLKFHDAQADLAPILQYVFEPVSERGFLQAFCCDVPLTQHMLRQPSVSRVHMTGSNKVHDAIVWGQDEAQAQQRREVGNPVLKVPITSELGNVTPAFIMPGEWAQESVAHVARLIAFNMLDNAGCNCLTPRAVVMAAEWPQADEFEAELKAALAALPAAPQWYPGSAARYQDFLDAHPGCELVQSKMPDSCRYSQPVKPWAIHKATVSSPQEANALPGLAEEFFAPVLTILRVSSPSATSAADNSAAAFVADLPEFAERGLWGTLVASVYAPPEARAAAGANALQTCIDDLGYGTVVVNGPTFVGFNFPAGAWGGIASDGMTLANAGSGIGKTLNSRLVDGVQKQVITFDKLFTVPPSELPLPAPITKALIGLLGNGGKGLLQGLLP